jgi:hypothetical protein
LTSPSAVESRWDDEQNQNIPRSVGGIAGGLLLSRMTRHVIRRHYTHDPG